MKKIILIITSFFSILTLAQKKYTFDKAVAIEVNDIKDSIVSKQYNLYNSMKDNYFSSIYFTKDSTSIFFRDFNGIQIIQARVDSTSFIKSETVTIDCKLVGKNYNNLKFKAKEYDYVQHDDTIYNGRSCMHLELKSNKNFKYQKRKKIQKCHIIIEKDEKQIPFIFFNTELLFNTWKKNNLNIKGKTVYAYFIDIYGNITMTFAFEYSDINRNFIIPEDCDYTKTQE